MDYIRAYLNFIKGMPVLFKIAWFSARYFPSLLGCAASMEQSQCLKDPVKFYKEGLIFQD
jgi:hypothetical protein